MEDFWWIPESMQRDQLMIGVGHHQPFDDDYEPDLTPINTARPVIRGWVHSVLNGQPAPECTLYPLGFLQDWNSIFDAKNVYRTVRIVDPDGAAVLGPFLIDIDNQDWANGYAEDLDGALDVARQATDVLTSMRLVEGQDFRIFFSGRKGFNVEVAPLVLEIQGDEQIQIKSSAAALEELCARLDLGTTNVDRIYGNRFGYRLKHPYIRVHDSWNCWLGKGGATCRRRVALSLRDLTALSAVEIIERSEAATHKS